MRKVHHFKHHCNLHTLMDCTYFTLCVKKTVTKTVSDYVHVVFFLIEDKSYTVFYSLGYPYFSVLYFFRKA